MAYDIAGHRLLESVTLCFRHKKRTSSGAHLARIRVRAHSDGVELEVSDDGSGAAAARDGGIGLISMRERAEQISGRLSIDARSDRGTGVRAWLPLGEVGPIDAREVRP